MSTTTIGDLQFVIGAQTRSLQQAQAEVNKMTANLRSAIGANQDFSNVNKQVEAGALRQVRAFQRARETVITLRTKLLELNKAGADTAAVSDRLSKSYADLRKSLEGGIVSQGKFNIALDKFQRQAANTSRALAQMNKSTGTSAAELTDMNARITDLAKSLQISFGPLSGIASRFTAFASLANRNTAALAALVTGVIAFSHAATATIVAGEKYESQMNVLEARVKSLGGTLGLTADELDQLARTMGRTTLTTAEETRTAMISLTTATNLTGESFKRALSLAQDLTATGFGGLNDNARKMAVILQDPVAGFERLREIGITFSVHQKEIIKAMVDTGRTAQAQTVLMDALSTRVGGAGVNAAKGLSGAWNTLKETLSNAAIDSYKNSDMSEKLAAAVRRVTAAIDEMTGKTDVLTKFGSVVSKVTVEMANALALLVENIKYVGIVLVGTFAGSAIASVIAAMKVGGGAVTGFTTVIKLLGRGLAALGFANPIMAMGTLIGLVTAALIKFDLFDKTIAAIGNTFDQIKINLKFESIVKGVTEYFDNSMTWIKENLAGTKFEALGESLTKGAENLTSVLGGAAKDFGKNVKEAAMGTDIASGIKTIIDDSTKAIKKGIDDQKKATEEATKATEEFVKKTTEIVIPVNEATEAYVPYTDALKSVKQELEALQMVSSGVDETTIKLAQQVTGVEIAFRKTADGIEIVNKHLREYNQAVNDKNNLVGMRKLIGAELPGQSGLKQIISDSNKLRDTYQDMFNRGIITDAEEFNKALEAITGKEKRLIDVFMKPAAAAEELIDNLDAIGDSLAMTDRELYVIGEQTKVNIEGLVGMGLEADKINDIMNNVGESAGRAFDKREEIKNLKAAMQELSSLVERSFDRIGSAITEMFMQGKDAAVSFSNVMKAIGSELVQFFVQLAIVNPIKNAFMGGGSPTMASFNGAMAGMMGGTGGRTSPYGGTVGGSGGFSGTGLLSSIWNGLSTPGMGAFATDIAASLGFGGTGQMIAGNAFSNLGYGALGSFGANILGLGGGVGGGVGGTIGTIAGSAFGGPIGSAIGGFLGSAIGGLFGSKPKRKTGLADVRIGDGSTVSVGGKGNDGSEALSIAKSVQTIIARTAEIVGADLNPGSRFSVRTFENFDKFDGSPLTLFGGKGYQKDFKDVESLVQMGSLDLMKNSLFVSGVDKEFQKALRSAKTIDEFINLAKQIKESTAKLKEWGDNLLSFTPFGREIKQIVADFAELRKHARELGYTLTQVNKAEFVALKNTELSIVNSINGVAQQARSILGIDALQGFKASMSFGSLSPLAPVDKFKAVRQQYNLVKGAALRGDQTAIGNLPSIAQEALTQARDVYASGPAFASFYKSVTATVDQVIANQQAIAKQNGIDLDLTIRETTNLQIAALKELQVQLTKDLRDVRVAIERNPFGKKR